VIYRLIIARHGPRVSDQSGPKPNLYAFETTSDRHRHTCIGRGIAGPGAPPASSERGRTHSQRAGLTISCDQPTGWRGTINGAGEMEEHVRTPLLTLAAAMTLLVACFGGDGDDADTTPSPTPSAVATPTAETSPSATATPTPTVATATPTSEATATPSATPTASGSAVCVNDPTRSATVVGLAVGGSAFADDLANIRDDHAIDAPRVAQVQGETAALTAVSILDGPWCNEEYTWWRIEAEQAVLAGDDGSLEGGTRGTVTGWVAEIDQFGVTNLGVDPVSLGEPASQ
jgi:hypothetical protein